jgi:hypothetical protein
MPVDVEAIKIVFGSFKAISVSILLLVSLQ